MRVNGPYVHTSGRLKGRKYVNIIDVDGKRTSMLYSRYLMEEKLGRKLSYDETVDHIDEDPSNDSLDNLQIVSRSENSKKSARLRREIEYIEFDCILCGKPGKQQAKNFRHNRNQGKAGPFCSRSCAGKHRPA